MSKANKVQGYKEIVSTANQILQGEIDLLQGDRSILQLAANLDCLEDAALVRLRGFVSEFDDVPSEETRNNFGKDYLSEVDKNLQSYLDKNKNSLLSLHKEIINIYQQQIDQFESSLISKLVKHDPIKVYFNDLEKKYSYENEIKLIQDQLPHCNSEEQVSDRLRHIFIDMYGEVPKEKKGIFDKLAKDIWTLLN